MNKILVSIIAVLILVIIAGIYKFLFQGTTRSAADGRTAIILEPAERDLVFTEMRAFLSSIQGIIHAANKNDMTEVARQARAVGAAAQQAVPGTLMGKLPMSFKKLGFDTHQKFDQLAMDAESMGDKEHTMEQLAELMQNCVACHSIFRLDVLGK